STSVLSNAAWDAALGHTRLDDLLSSPQPRLSTSANSVGLSSSPTTVHPPDSQAIASGLTQLNKYLTRTWYRAGIPVQLHDDSSQAVYATLLQTMGRARFDSLVGEVGQSGIRETFSRETSEGVDFFRALDMVKKRAQREKVYQSLDSVD